MNRTNEICVMREQFDNFEEYKQMIGDIVNALLQLDYLMVIRTELGVNEQVIIEYQYADKQMGDAYPYWLYPEEAETIEYKE